MKLSPNNVCVFLFSTLLIFGSSHIRAQYKIRHNWDHPTSLFFNNNKNGFFASASLVAVFSTGVASGDGFRLGGGFSVGYTLKNWTIETGSDFYKATQNFGLGTSFAGITYLNNGYGGSYTLNHYYQGEAQTSGILGVNIKDFSFRFEDDILAYPFVGFKIYDRYRTAAIELRYKSFMLGTNVYSTDINGQTVLDDGNKKGRYRTGRQISSPVYIGYAYKDFLIRTGINGSLGGKIGQNLWHKFIFNTPNFEEGDYNSYFLQIGTDKPYTLY